MVDQPNRFDPDAEVWDAVAHLERKGYTRSEIAAALDHVADEVDPTV